MRSKGLLWLFVDRGPRANDQRPTATADSLRSPPAIIDGKLKPGIRRKQFGNLAQPLRQRGGSKQGIIALPQVVIIHIQVKREQVYGNRVRKCGLQIIVLMFLD